MSAQSLLGAGPLVFNFPISAQLSIQVSVSGDARQNATVSILNGSVVSWSTTLTQFSPTAELPYDIVAGDYTLKAGAGFVLTIPTTLQMGSVVARGTLVSPTQPDGQKFAVTVASWPLTSSV